MAQLLVKGLNSPRAVYRQNVPCPHCRVTYRRSRILGSVQHGHHKICSHPSVEKDSELHTLGGHFIPARDWKGARQNPAKGSFVHQLTQLADNRPVGSL